MIPSNFTFAGAAFGFGALPPEINSGRMYLGPGSAPLTAAAAAWEALSSELSSAAGGYASAVADLSGRAWLGPTSVAMSAAAAPFVAWLHETSGRTAEIAGLARAAAAAYELAFAMTVPPPVITANRALLLALVATNFFGQNTAAIAAAEAHYAQMWLQDATAMYLYAESSALASSLPSFSRPPRTSDPAGPAAHIGVAADSPAQQVHSALSSPLVQILEHIPNMTNSILSPANAVTSGRGIQVINLRLAAQESVRADSPIPVRPYLASASRTGGFTAARVSAAWGRAGLVGKLSAPPSWFTAAPEVRPTAPAAPAGPVASADPAGVGSVFSQSALGTLSREEPRSARARSKPIIVRSPAAG